MNYIARVTCSLYMRTWANASYLLYVCVYACVICMHACVYVFMYVCNVYVYIRVCMRVCMYDLKRTDL